MALMKYGVVQGRLSPQKGDFVQDFPIDTWRDEFRFAKELGASHIEWIDGAPNAASGEFSTLLKPYLGRKRLSRAARRLRQKLEVPISAVCLDWMVDVRHARSNYILYDELQLSLVCEAMQDLGLNRLVLPFLGAASLTAALQLEPVFFDAAIHVLNDFMQEYPTLTFSVETDLDVSGMQRFLSSCDPRLRVTFDTGNLTRLGYDLNQHLDVYSARIDNIHVKDCMLAGGSVQLGTGDTDLSVIKRLAASPSVEFMTFQTARSPGTERETFAHNVRTIEEILCR